jgi:LysM repeat protein
VSDARGVREPFLTFMKAAHAELEQANFAEVLKELTRYYKHPELTPEESQALVQLLDQVAGTVVYSRQHLLEPPYRVKPGESLQQIAAQYDVPWQLLAKINGIQAPDRLAPGEEIKVVRGPFHARVDLAAGEATLFLQDTYYAGRFALDDGPPTAELAGTYTVRGKSGPTRDTPGAALALELDDQVRLEGGGDPNAVAGPSPSPRTLRFGPRDIQDMVDILSVGSRVVIRR